MSIITVDGYQLEVVATRGNKVPFKGTTNWYQFRTDGTKTAEQIRKMYAEHEGIPLSEDADWYGKRVKSCVEGEKKGEFVLEVFEPYTD